MFMFVLVYLVLLPRNGLGKVTCMRGSRGGQGLKVSGGLRYQGNLTSLYHFTYFTTLSPKLRVTNTYQNGGRGENTDVTRPFLSGSPKVDFETMLGVKYNR